MLRELHILRACNAVKDGLITVRAVLNTPGPLAA